MPTKLKTYIIEETTSYYLKAATRSEAERLFLDSISTKAPIESCEVHERDVYPDPENRLLTV